MQKTEKDQKRKRGSDVETLKIRDDFIKLGQALKASGLCDTGSQAKEVVQGGLVEVNGEIDTRRGRKLVPGDVFSYDGRQVQIEG